MLSRRRRKQTTKRKRRQMQTYHLLVLNTPLFWAQPKGLRVLLEAMSKLPILPMKSLTNWIRNCNGHKAIQRNCPAMQKAWWVNLIRNCLKMETLLNPSVKSSTMPMKTGFLMKSCWTSYQIQSQKNLLLSKPLSTSTVHLSGSSCWKSWASLRLISLRHNRSSARSKTALSWIACKNPISCLLVSL